MDPFFPHIDGEPKVEVPPLNGWSLHHYANSEIDLSASLLGNRLLSRGHWGVLFAPSGVGKSFLSVQLAACWSAGTSALQIPLTQGKPLKIFIVQAEDDRNDMIEMSRVIHRLNFTDEQSALVQLNTHMVWLNDVTGSRFWIYLNAWLETAYKDVDLIIINPLMNYLGGSLYDEKVLIPFLVELNKLLKKFNCSALLIHHTPKPEKGESKQVQADQAFLQQYSMAGPALLTNQARCSFKLTALKGTTFKFSCVKRGDRIGWPHPYEKFICHSREHGIPLWIPATPEQTNIAQSNGKDPEALLAVFTELDPLSIEELIVRAHERMGENKVRLNLKVLLERDLVSFAWEKNPAGKGGDVKRYSKTRNHQGEST
jgi:hypothetical protein